MPRGSTVADLVPGPGEPLAPADRAPVEHALGVDLGHARVHVGPAASAAASAMRAEAYTVGSHVVVGKGSFAPASAAGRNLLAHELVHVAEQAPAGPTPPAAAVSGVTDPAGHLERTTAHVAGRALAPPVRPPREGAGPTAAAGRAGPVGGATATNGTTTAPASPLVVARQPEGHVETPDPDWQYVPDPDAVPDESEELRTAAREFEIVVSAAEPSLFLVPLESTRADMAHRLLDDESRAEEILVVEAPAHVLAGAGGRLTARPRTFASLVPAANDAVQAAMQTLLDADVAWTVSSLSQRVISRQDEAELTRRFLRWSQRSDVRDAGGRTWFDRYLDALHGRYLVTEFWGTRKSALDWLLVEASSHQELIRKAIALRSTSYSTGYTVTDTRPQLAPGDVIGRFFYSRTYGNDHSIQVAVHDSIADEPTRERAEIVTRNADRDAMRAVVPGGNGRWSGYRLRVNRRMPTSKHSHDMRPSPAQDPGGEFFWYHPGTLYIAPGQFQVDVVAGGPEHAALRRSLLVDALTSATARDLGALVSLDFDALATATTAEREQIVRLVLDGRGKGSEAGVSLISRVILATPNAQFPAFERQLADTGLIGRLFEMSRMFPALAAVGRAFTLKTLQALPLEPSAFAVMPTFRYGEDASGVLHYVAAGTRREQVRTPDGQPTGTERDVIDLQPAILRQGIGALVRNFTGSQAIAENNGTLVRGVLPTQLVKVDVIGPRPATMYMTALEAAGALDLSFAEYSRRVIGPAVNLNLMALSAINLGFAFGPALAGGLAAGGVRGGLAALAEHAATQAGRQALRTFAYEAVLLGSMQVVDAYRSELQQSEAGRAFLALYDVAMVMLIARDVYAVARSGTFGQLGRLGLAAVGAVTGAARRALARTVDEIRAWAVAVPRAVREGVLVPAGAAGTLRPRDPGRFMAMLSEARAEIATTSLMTSLEGAGASTTLARRVMQALERTPELAAARTAIARRATEMAPAEAERLLTAVERTLGNSRRLNRELDGWLRAAARADDPVSYLAQVDTLLARRGVSAEAIEVIGSKAAAGTADIGFINRSGLTDRDLSFLGRDSRTPWQAYERVAAGTPTTGETIWARGSIRGAAAELSAQRGFAGLLPDFRITGRQVQMNGKIVDFQITARGLGHRHGFEVKGWTQATWQEALAAARTRATGQPLSDAQRKAVAKLDHMMSQLQAARSATGNAPYLGLTNALSASERSTLRALLRQHGVGDTVLVGMSEATIVSVGRQLRAALGLP